jgi:hypothetical protein
LVIKHLDLDSPRCMDSNSINRYVSETMGIGISMVVITRQTHGLFRKYRSFSKATKTDARSKAPHLYAMDTNFIPAKK